MQTDVIQGFELSPQQKRLWSLLRHDEHQLHTQCAVLIHGRLENARLIGAIEQVVERHEILRTSFRRLEGMTIPLQVVHEGRHFELTHYEWHELSADEQAESIERLWHETQQAVFDLEREGQLRVCLVGLNEEERLLLLKLPALCADVAGLRNLVAEISRCYAAAIHGQALDGEPMQYADISEWQNQLLDAEDRAPGRRYWSKRDISSIGTLKLPYEQKTAKAGHVAPLLFSRTLDSIQVQRLEALANKYETSISVVLLTAWQILLGRLMARTSTIMGVALNRRKYKELEAALGLLTRFVPIECDLEQRSRFEDVLQQQQAGWRQANTWQENYTWENLTNGSEATAEQHYFPFCFEYAEPPVSSTGGGVRFTIIKEYACTDRFHVKLSCIRTNEALRAEYHYDAGVYREADMIRLAGEFETLLKSVLEDEQMPVSDLEIVSEDERQQLLVEWNDTARPYPQQVCIHELFERQAAERAGAVAVVHEAQQLTYEELNRRANQLGHYLRRRGVGAEVRVGLCVERSLEMIIGLLGILKAGGAYVPLEPSYPGGRLSFMLDDTAAPVLLTQAHLLERLPAHGAEVICLDSEWEMIAAESTAAVVSEVSAENLAYVIYTSGSTGQPKGVGVTHRQLVHSTMARMGYYPQSPSSFLLLSSFAFDSSVAGVFWTLCGGGRLVLPGEGMQREARELVKLVRAEQVSHLLCLPSLYGQLLEESETEELAGLKAVIVAGEACPPQLPRRHEEVAGAARLYNEYGPTEASVWSTVQECVGEAEAEVVPIGRPIANARVYLLDEQMRVAPIGVSGEIYVGGAGVTRGYLNRPELTGVKFIPDPFSGEGGGRLYRTGDVGRYRSDGRLEFVGRVDGQVKLRGYRIELGEVEAVLGTHPAVESVVVVAREAGGEKHLIGYVVIEAASIGNVTGSELRSYLAERLPNYMVPGWVMVLEEWPLLANGKVDRQALPAPEQVLGEGEGSRPRTPIEEVVAGIWAEVLRLKEVSVTANFFELGGHSLLATQVMSRLREAFQRELPVRSLFATPTVRGLAATVEEQLLAEQGMTIPPIVRAGRAGELPLSFAQQRLWFADQLSAGESFYNVAAAVQLSGRLNVGALERTLTEIIRRHEVLRTSFPARAGEPMQVIGVAREFELAVTDLSELEVEEREERARRLAEEEAAQPFDLGQGSLLRARLLRLAEEKHVALLTMHHIVSDGWSMGVLIKEVSVLYEAYSRGLESPLTELPIQYADYAVWQRERLAGEVLARQLEYWQEQLRGAPERLALPTDKARPAVQSFRGDHQRFTLTPELSERVKALSRGEDVSLFMTLLAAFKVLLRFYSGQTDIVVGIDIANRNRIEVENLIGFFINILVTRNDLSGNPTFQELLRMVRETTLGAYAHQDLPFERLVEELQPERSLSGMPLVQTMFSFHNAPKAELKLFDLTLTPFETNGNTAKRDLTLFMMETEQGLAGTWNYNSDLFNAGTIKRMSMQFELLMSEMVKQPEGRLSDALAVLAEAERKQAAMEKRDRRESRLSQFMNISPKAVSLTHPNLIKTGYLTSEKTMPLVVRPALDDVDLIEWAKSQRQSLEAQLLEHGAILFRGFSTESPAEFEQFALRICPELFGEYGDLPREGVSGKVYGSTPYPPEQAILFHNESSHLQRWPMKIWFFCMRAAQQGGDTPIVDCRKVYEALDPKIRERFAKKKVMYVRNYVDGLDVSWQDFFRTSDKSVVEDFCRKASIDFEWKNGEVLRTRQVCHAVLPHPKTGQVVFFNQLQAHHVSCLEPATRESLLSLLKEEDLPRNVYYGDGSPIEDSVIDEIREVYQRLAINFRWEERDILMLDNMLTAHGRNAYTGERKIVVAIGEMISNQNVSMGTGK